MKCPQCGDEMKNGRCVFCGYRPTEADQQAYARWADQKRDAERGFSGPEPEKRGKPEKKIFRPPKNKAAPERKARPERKPEPAPRRTEPKKAASKMRRKPGRQRDGPGFFGRLVPKLVVMAWVLLIVYLMISELAAGMPP